MKLLLSIVATGLLLSPVRATSLREVLGRSETRVWSAATPLGPGRSPLESGLASRLDALGFERVHERPTRPGEYFWGQDRFWIYRRACRVDGRDRPAALFALELADGLVVRAIDEKAQELPWSEAWLEPELLSESLGADRAPRVPIDLERLPEHVWRSVLAAEDHRFYDHPGLDGRALARALLANVRSGEVEQGGSTITQQLIKNRDLTPKRTFGRKTSEAVRALVLETEYPKDEILAAYLDLVYMGHVDGLAVHGLGAAARAYFSLPAERLSLAQSAALAALIQAPNRLSPLRHPEALEERRTWVLERLEALGWVDGASIAAARRDPVTVRPTPPERPLAPHFLTWIRDETVAVAGDRIEAGRGVVVETTLDPWLQRIAEEVVASGLADLRSRLPDRSATVQAAFVVLDPVNGSVLAAVGGDPLGSGDRFDRVRLARRQPGSTVKPLLLLEAFEDCGDRDPLHPTSRVADEPIEIPGPDGPWTPVNADHRFRGDVTLRQALRESLNVPFVRIARWCGLEATAERVRRSGLQIPEPVPPSYTLGAIEVSPLELARAYTVFLSPGKVATPRPFTRIERPKGWRLATRSPELVRVVRPSSAFLVADMLTEVASAGTARGAALEGRTTGAKTGTSSGARDAWLAGFAGGLVAVVWVGRDDGGPLGLGGGAVAAPLWREAMSRIVAARPSRGLLRPGDVVERWIDEQTGLLVDPGREGARPELFRRFALPPHRRFWRHEAVPVIR